jgi:hypothetical protein
MNAAIDRCSLSMSLNFKTPPTCLKSKLGDNVRLERFDADCHALFVDDPDTLNRVLPGFH